MKKRDRDLPGNSDGDIELRAKQLFDESVDGLDARTRSRLNQGRQRALAVLLHRDRRPWRAWLPAAGVAAAAAVTIFFLGGQQAAISPVPWAAEGDFELLMDETSLEMLEDLEFYSWIDIESTDENVG